MVLASSPIGYPKTDRPIGTGWADRTFRLLNCRLVSGRLTHRQLDHTSIFSLATWDVGHPLDRQADMILAAGRAREAYGTGGTLMLIPHARAHT
jgi:hypothetical protein